MEEFPESQEQLSGEMTASAIMPGHAGFWTPMGG